MNRDFDNKVVADKFNSYPNFVQDKMLHLRELVFESANELSSDLLIEETLKWGEPAYLSKHGSTIRMDWKEKNPDQYAMYFKCTSKLVPTFKMVFGKTFEYEGKRAIVFKLNDKVPVKELKSCIISALAYHKVKQLPTLGL